MTTLFDVLAGRLRALLLADSGLDLEADYLRREVERKASLLRQAALYEAELLGDVAGLLREGAARLGSDRSADSDSKVAGPADGAASRHAGNGSALPAPTATPAIARGDAPPLPSDSTACGLTASGPKVSGDPATSRKGPRPPQKK